MKPALVALMLLWSTIASAHKPSDSYLILEVQPDGVAGRWDIALRDLDYAIGLDGNDDGVITWGELRARRRALGAYALARLKLGAAGAPCAAEPSDLLVDEHTDGKYAVLRFTARCPSRPQALTVDYRLLFDLDPQHRGLLRLVDGHRTHSAVFGPENFRQNFELGRSGDYGAQILAYGREGVWHIWVGFDHILFLLSLLLPAVLVRETGRWLPAESFRAVCWEVVRIVTAFTLAHSITLSLAVLGYVALPSRWVESTIAASVVAAATNNLVPLFFRRRALLAFIFGLVHGLGFATVLLDLGLPDMSRAAALAGFNLGVEAGQLAIVGAFLPIAFGLSRFGIYQPAVLKAGSAGIAAVACVWLLERAFDLRLTGLLP